MQLEFKHSPSDSECLFPPECGLQPCQAAVRPLLPGRITVQQQHKPEGAEKGRCPGWCARLCHICWVIRALGTHSRLCDLVDYPHQGFVALMPGACTWSVSAPFCSSSSLGCQVRCPLSPTQFKRGKQRIHGAVTPLQIWGME